MIVEYAAGGIRFNACGSGEKRNGMFKQAKALAKRKAEQGGGSSGGSSRSLNMDLQPGFSSGTPPARRRKKNELERLIDSTDALNPSSMTSPLPTRCRNTPNITPGTYRQ